MNRTEEEKARDKEERAICQKEQAEAKAKAIAEEDALIPVDSPLKDHDWNERSFDRTKAYLEMIQFYLQRQKNDELEKLKKKLERLSHKQRISDEKKRNDEEDLERQIINNSLPDKSVLGINSF